jgi:hypothetical protein
MGKKKSEVIEKKDQGKTIENVAVLDIRSATEESIAGISRISNVAMLLFSRETAPLVTRSKINVVNVAALMEVPADAKFINGQEVFSHDYFKDLSTPLNIVVNGQVRVDPDVPAEDIEKGLGELYINGQILYPEHLAGVVQSKIHRMNGQSQTYAKGDKVAVGRLILDENYLRSLDDSSVLVVIGNLKIPQVLPNDLLGQKLKRVQVIGEIVCREENAQTIFACLDNKTGSVKVTAIPTGFELVEKQLVLDADMLESLPARKLYCTGRIQIDRNVDPAALDKSLEALVVKDMVICPAALKGVISRKCNMLETRAVFYEGELWLVEGESNMLASRFDYLEGKATMVVLGELVIAPDIDSRVLIDRLAKVHNLGVISCTSKQRGAIQALLGLSDGELVSSTPTETVRDNIIGNVAYLKL